MNRKAMIPLLSAFVFWGSLYIVSKIALRTIPPTGLFSLMELRGAAFSLTKESALAVLYMGLMGTAAAHSLWNYSLSQMDAGFVLGGVLICCGIVAAVRCGRHSEDGVSVTSVTVGGLKNRKKNAG